MRRIRPDLLVLAELELWPNLIAAARASGARVAVVNGRLSERSFRGYRRIRRLLRADAGSTRSGGRAERRIRRAVRRSGRAGSERVQVTGSIKFDGCQSDRQNPDDAGAG